MTLRTLLCVVALAAIPLAAQLAQEDKAAGFKPLFNGKDLSEWDGDPRLWRVEKGVLIGSTDGVEIRQNTFLIHKKPVSNFHLKVQVKLRNGNSGIQFRSTALPDYVVQGLQADMASGNWWGSIYDEKGQRGVIVNGWKGKAEHVVKAGDWNDFEVRADGEDIEIKVNGLQTAVLKDNSKLEGVLALQLHRGPGMQVEFRNLRIKTWK
jgi:hypothetical protein